MLQRLQQDETYLLLSSFRVFIHNQSNAFVHKFNSCPVCSGFNISDGQFLLRISPNQFRNLWSSWEFEMNSMNALPSRRKYHLAADDLLAAE